jgi:hypothetical protein
MQMKLSVSSVLAARPGLGLGLALAFCSAAVFAAAAEIPARLIQPSEASRLELQGAVAQLLQVPSVVVADDALTGESLMVISKARPRDARGLQLSGRDFDKPEQFQLVKIEEACVLVRLRTGARATLGKSQCEAAGS